MHSQSKNHPKREPLKVYDLPYTERKLLCDILDQNNQWQELGIKMGYDQTQLKDLEKFVKKGGSITDELLNMWGLQNHNVLELFSLLARLEYYEAMKAIKDFVDETYHKHIKHSQPNHVIKPINCSQHAENFNDSAKVIQGAKLVNQEISRDDNITVDRLKPVRIENGSINSAVSFAESAGAIPNIPYNELKNAAHGWSDQFALGKGGFGTVFEGIWKCTKVAIKRIDNKNHPHPQTYNEQFKQSINELHCLNAYRHDNILPLYGYSIGGPHDCLVYQYMAGGSLDYRLKDSNKPLSWPTRLNIAIGVARGLQFLHTIGTKPLIHGDIKTANILLDPMDQPKIGDFGLAREGPKSNYSHIKISKIQGTRPYLPNEFLRGSKLSTKVDTYSFGVVLFEIGTALSAYSSKREEKFLRDFIVRYEGDIMDLKDKRIQGFEDAYRGLIDIGKICVSDKAKDRPEMVIVLIKLESVPL